MTDIHDRRSLREMAVVDAPHPDASQVASGRLELRHQVSEQVVVALIDDAWRHLDPKVTLARPNLLTYHIERLVQQRDGRLGL